MQTSGTLVDQISNRAYKSDSMANETAKPCWAAVVAAHWACRHPLCRHLYGLRLLGTGYAFILRLQKWPGPRDVQHRPNR